MRTSSFLLTCTLFLGKGHSQAALSLWNNMLEPVGGKQWFWHMGETLKCPTEQYPYIFTNKNSAKALEEYQRSTTTEEVSPKISSSSSKPSASSTEQHRHHKHHKSDSGSLLSRSQFAVFIGCFFLLMLLLILAITKRQQIRVFILKNGRHHLNGFENPDENDDVELWNRSNVKSGFSLNNGIPKTHGARISFE